MEGMPLGVTGLSDREYGLIETWLAQGAPVDALPRKATAGEQRQIAQWEGFLNQRGARERLVARWLYEHLFIAHLYFDN
ncbi:fatty acid cis/trans isomerase, partial [Acinetobacter baumannii]